MVGVNPAAPCTMSPMASALPRPRQVTIAGWMIVAGSVALVLTVFQQIAGLHSIDTREAVARVLSEPPFDGLGMGVDRVLEVIRVVSMVAAACATATAILGWQALQRSRSARIALSVLAVPLFLAGMGTGGVLSTVVAVAVALLWMQPARDWFDGRWKPEPATDERRAQERARPVAPEPQQPPRAEQPPPYAGWPPPQGVWPPPQGVPAAPAASWSPPDVVRRRPPAVVAAVVITWVCSLLLGGLFVAGAAWLMSSPETLMDEMSRQQPELVRDGTVTVGLLRGMLAVMTAGIVVWVLAACVSAFFVLRGARWARVVLLVSSSAAGLGLFLCLLVNAAMLLPLAGAVAVVALLVRRDVAAWFSAPGRPPRAG